MLTSIFFIILLIFISIYILRIVIDISFIDKNEIKNCSFLLYHSSKLEIEWLNILKENEFSYNNKYCSITKVFNERLNILQEDIRRCKNNLNYCNGDDLSYFIYKYNNGSIVKEYIEPLFGILRNTFSVCSDGVKGDILSKEYLLPSYYSALQKPIVYIDAGASTFNSGEGGSSQSFFYEFYKKYKQAEYKSWYLWESTEQNITQIYSEIPNDLKEKYHYYNKPIEANINSKDNPLSIIKLFQKQFYVIFKIDVDNNNVELPIFNYLLKNNEIIPNEFYYEYHFYQPYMMKWWNKDLDYNCSLYCATKKFLHLRKKGIRSHPWV